MDRRSDMKSRSIDVLSVFSKKQRKKHSYILKLVHLANQQLTGQSQKRQKLIQAFIEAFLSNVSLEEIKTHTNEELLSSILSAWDNLRCRKTDKIKVSLSNILRKSPKGFEVSLTVIEIVSNNLPFLIDSITAELNRLNVQVRLFINSTINIQRDTSGIISEIGTSKTEMLESVIHIEVDEQCVEKKQILSRTIRSIADDVQAVVQDWKKMRERLNDIISHFDFPLALVDSQATIEIKSFFHWVKDEHFTFLGYREYDFFKQTKQLKVRARPRRGLGILRKSSNKLFDGWDNNVALPEPLVESFQNSNIFFVCKANKKSNVHRSVHIDTIGVKIYNDQGDVAGVKVFAGLFASDFYNQTICEIPFLRVETNKIMKLMAHESRIQDRKALLHILENLPRDQLFQFDTVKLAETSLGILNMRGRQQVRLFAHIDSISRLIFCLVYVPREKFSTGLRLKFKSIIEKNFIGVVTEENAQVNESPLARLNFIVEPRHVENIPKNLETIEAKLAQAARNWSDDLVESLSEEYGERRGKTLFKKYMNAFPAGYRDRVDARHAVQDIRRIEEVFKTKSIGLNLHRPYGNMSNEVRFGLYNEGGPLELSGVLPMLENMGLTVIDEVPHRISPEGKSKPVWFHDFGLRTKNGSDIKIDVKDKARLEEMFRQIWLGSIENDGFNSLALSAKLTWREVIILRAYCKFLLQAKVPFSQSYMEETLERNSEITCDIVSLFRYLFDPALQYKNTKRINTIRNRIETSLQRVNSLDQDRILRRFINLVDATLRTNFFQSDHENLPKGYLVFKLDSARITDLPLPRPFREIFLHSPRVDAIHLRGGLVARGGLRWSDRREDFRAEILGLMKSQMTKNSVIIPVGAKGGFVVKNTPKSGCREEVLKEGIACYKIFISAMLDLTDNIKNGKVVHPKDVVCLDGDDPYLVVAADKGTASFSDIANCVARKYQFWLDDAFASGGSDGYDHKQMGITARGAWESVKRHFREIGKDITKESFTCIGIGDMSGDVFGNGLIYTDHIKLIGAFNHLHIFVDPHPHPEIAINERRRLFSKGQSDWTDYNLKLISKGGGIFDRSAKSIPLTPEIQEVFGFANIKSVTPNELIRSMLKAKVDLLWFGGIGTYVKAENETDFDSGDRINDPLRINGNELGALVVGEGANLGLTQLGRVEYSLAGGRINADFIDNSAGVDCSDHEVNIKILLHDAVQKTKFSMKQRNALLREMSGEVAELVLMDNYRQSMALTNAFQQSFSSVEEHRYFIQELERKGELNRDVEYLPNEEVLDLRSATGQGLTRPELAILLAYSKNSLYQYVLSSTLPNDEYLADNLRLYFPKAIQKKFPHLIKKHRLRREIISTYVANSIINRTGPSFVTTLNTQTNAAPAAIARSYLIFREVFDLSAVWNAIEALDNSVSALIQSEMHLVVLGLIRQGTKWFLQNSSGGGSINNEIKKYRKKVSLLRRGLDQILTAELECERNKRVKLFLKEGTPRKLAYVISNLELMAPACDIIQIAIASRKDLMLVAKVYHTIGTKFGFDWLRWSAQGLPDNDEWNNVAVEGLIEDFFACQAALTRKVISDAIILRHHESMVENWIAEHKQEFEFVMGLVKNLRSTPTLNLAKLMVVNKKVRQMVFF